MRRRRRTMRINSLACGNKNNILPLVGEHTDHIGTRQPNKEMEVIKSSTHTRISFQPTNACEETHTVAKRFGLQSYQCSSSLKGATLCGKCNGADANCYWNHAADVGKTFLLQFHEGFQLRLALQREWLHLFRGEIGTEVAITIECGRVYHVKTEEVDGLIYLSGGWNQLVAGEMLGISDIGLFTYVGPSSFTLRVLNEHGIELPHTVLWADRVPSNPSSSTNIPPQNAVNAGPRWFENCTRFYITAARRKRLEELRTKQGTDCKFYVGKLTRGQLKHGLMYFSKVFSGELPDDATNISLLFEDDPRQTEAKIKKTEWGKVSYITAGWLPFARANGLRDDNVCAFIIRPADVGLIVRVFKL